MKEWKSIYCLNSDSMVQVLLEFGADVTVRDDTHSTPLHLAASRTLSEIVRLLTEHGADVNALDGMHRAPLHLALALDPVSVNVLRILLSTGLM